MIRPRYSISRRTLVSAGLSGAGSIVLDDAPLTRQPVAAAEQPGTSHTDASSLKSNFGFKGEVFHSSDPGFEEAAFGDLWNKLQPKRHPQIVAQVRDEQDVVAA
jgi:hypothetical protein